MWNTFRNQLSRMISESGTDFEIFTSWENVKLSQAKGLFLESEYSIHSWFFIKDDKEIWKLTYNSSDGGCWNSDGPLVYGYKAVYSSIIRQHIKQMYEYKNKQSLETNNYRKFKHRNM
ncbi:TPA: hypothetical protein NGT00_004585 [Vibrio parahaemolyticus]|nr:hypothetical protein [Vibrio parahaemolyticus]HCG6738961.1 hypothetical protein [Vibrio parahaemolyticus]